MSNNRKLGIIGGVATGTVVAAVGGIMAFTEYIPPEMNAIKESKFGGGIQEEVYEGGQLYFQAPGVTFNTFPKRWQLLDFSGEDFGRVLEEKIEGYNNEGVLQVPSSDGFLNKFEITVMYRIEDPVAVITKIGKGTLYENFVRSKADPALKEAFGSMKAEQIYDVEKRTTASEEAKRLLNSEVKEYGLSVGQVLVRKFEYPGDYEQRISGKVLQKQLEIASREQGIAAEMAAKVKKIEAEGEANVEVEKSRAAKEAKIINSQASLYRRKKDAEGRLLVETATADGQKLVNEAYKGEGSGYLVGLEMAEKAGAIKRIYLKSCSQGGVNPLDLGEMVKKLSGDSLGEAQ